MKDTRPERSPWGASPPRSRSASAARSESGRAQRIIGYVEHVALPLWGAGTIVAKMDTGADTSALHVDALELVGATRVAFEVALTGPEGEVPTRVQARIARRGWVRSSNGDEEERIFVRTPIVLAGLTRVVELSLCDRSRMQQPMLLGRSALEGAFLIDPSQVHLAEEPSTTESPAAAHPVEGQVEGRAVEGLLTEGPTAAQELVAQEL